MMEDDSSYPKAGRSSRARAGRLRKHRLPCSQRTVNTEIPALGNAASFPGRYGT